MAKKPFPFSVCEQCCSDTDPAALEQIEKELKNKVDKVDGKGLSTNDYTNTEKAKVGDAHTQINQLWGSLDETQQTARALSKNTLIVTESNEATISDCTDGAVTSLNLFGYCVQEGTPSLSTPAAIIPVEPPYFDGCGARFSVMNPYTLYGIPVASGGNFTDANGQEWICDEIDFVNKKYTKRCEFYTFTGDEGTYLSGSGWHIDGVATSIYIKAFVGDKVCGNTTSNAQNCMSPYFKASKRNFTDAPTTNDVCCANGEFAYLRFTNTTVGIISTDTDAEKLAKAKEYLAACYAQGNPISILYPIATPVETAFTDEVALAEFAKMQTAYPSVTVASNANFLIGYNATVQGYVDKQIEKLTNAIISLGGNV